MDEWIKNRIGDVAGAFAFFRKGDSGPGHSTKRVWKNRQECREVRGYKGGRYGKSRLGQCGIGYIGFDAETFTIVRHSFPGLETIKRPGCQDENPVGFTRPMTGHGEQNYRSGPQDPRADKART